MPADQALLEDLGHALVRQKKLSEALDGAGYEQQFANAGTPAQADLNSEMLPGASGFLTAVPSKKLGLAS